MSVYGIDFCLVCNGLLEGREKLVGFCVHCEVALTKEVLDEMEAPKGEVQ